MSVLQFKPVAEMSVAERVDALRMVSTFLNEFSIHHQDVPILRERDAFWERFSSPANTAVEALLMEYLAYAAGEGHVKVKRDIVWPSKVAL